MARKTPDTQGGTPRARKTPDALARQTLHDALPAAVPDPAQVVEDRDFMERLRFLIRQLPPRPRQITELWLAGCTTRRICAQLGHTRQAVNRRKRQVVRILRKQLKLAQVA